MSRARRDRPWLGKRGDRWCVFWYEPSTRSTKRLSLRIKDDAQADLAAAAIDEGVPVKAIAGYVAEHTAPVDEVPPAEEWRVWAMKMCRRARENAKQKGREYAINPEMVLGVVSSQGYRCAVTRMRFSLEHTYRNPFAPSLDQIRPGQGYVPGNIRVVTVIANTAMNGWGEKALRKMIAETRLQTCI